jgi:subtilisin family serine protease
MSSRGRLAIALCVVLAVGVQAPFALALPKALTEFRSVGQVPAGDQVLLVTFEDHPDQRTAAARLAGLGTVDESVPEVGVWALRPADDATARAAALGRQGVTRAEWSLVHKIDALPDARPVPNPALPLITLPEPTDPFYAVANQNQQWSLRQGNWTLGLSGYDRPTIAILDSGLDTTHEDWDDPGLTVYPRSTILRVDRALDGSERGHGTHVAGIAAAPANGVGIVGVAPASGTPALSGVSKVMPVQITNVQGESTDTTMMAGIRWAVNHGAKVINISSGGRGGTLAFQDTVNWAFKRGAIIIASAGNEGARGDSNGVNFPAGYDHVVGVGALCDAIVTPDCPTPFGRAEFSNHNYTVDVMAPGVNVVSTVPLVIHDREVAPGYAFKDGTSMAAPYVAGVAALIYASHPGITPYQVTRILQTTSSNGAAGRSRSSNNGWGAVNPLLAAQAQAPVDDLSEPNDDIKYLAKRDNMRVTRTPITLTARMDNNDDAFDNYPVILRKGERMKVTVTALQGRLALRVYRPRARSVYPIFETAKQLRERRVLGETRRATPGTRTVVVKAKETGRHYVSLGALAGGGDYTVVIRRV